MSYQVEYYIVDRRALPEVYVKVVEAKRMLATGEVQSVQEAAKKLDISRSSFYKYKDMIEPFTDTSSKKTVTLSCTLDDEPGALSQMLAVVGENKANILTIHQSIPINGLADVSLSMELGEATQNLGVIMEGMRAVPGVYEIKIVARE